MRFNVMAKLSASAYTKSYRDSLFCPSCSLSILPWMSICIVLSMHVFIMIIFILFGSNNADISAKIHYFFHVDFILLYFSVAFFSLFLHLPSPPLTPFLHHCDFFFLSLYSRKKSHNHLRFRRIVFFFSFLKCSLQMTICMSVFFLLVVAVVIFLFFLGPDVQITLHKRRLSVERTKKNTMIFAWFHCKLNMRLNILWPAHTMSTCHKS